MNVKQDEYEKAVFEIPGIGKSPEDFIVVRKFERILYANEDAENEPSKCEERDGVEITKCPKGHTELQYVEIRKLDGSNVGNDSDFVPRDENICVVPVHVILSCSKEFCPWAYDVTNGKYVRTFGVRPLYYDRKQ